MWKDIALILLICLLFLGYFYLQQRKMIYFPDKAKPTRTDFQAEDFEEIRLQTADHLELYSWYKPARAPYPTILYLHGNAGHIGYRMSIIRPFIRQGYGVFLLEYRGYGGNPGKPSESGFYQDAEAAIDYLSTLGIKSDQLVLFGASIGTGVAVELAMHHSACALILQSPMTSLPDAASWHYPWLFLPPWDKFNNLEKINKIAMPLLILHGKEDQIIPYHMGLSLYKRASVPKRMISLEDQGHHVLHNKKYYHLVGDFIKEHCI